MIIKGSEKLGAEWRPSGTFFMVQKNNVIELSPAQAKSLIAVIERGMEQAEKVYLSDVIEWPEG